MYYRSAETWPQKLLMQLMPKTLIGSIGGTFLKNSKSVFFLPQACEALETLVQVMSSGYVRLHHLTESICHLHLDLILFNIILLF